MTSSVLSFDFGSSDSASKPKPIPSRFARFLSKKESSLKRKDPDPSPTNPDEKRVNQGGISDDEAELILPSSVMREFRERREINRRQSMLFGSQEDVLVNSPRHCLSLPPPPPPPPPPEPPKEPRESKESLHVESPSPSVLSCEMSVSLPATNECEQSVVSGSGDRSAVQSTLQDALKTMPSNEGFNRSSVDRLSVDPAVPSLSSVDRTVQSISSTQPIISPISSTQPADPIIPSISSINSMNLPISSTQPIDTTDTLSQATQSLLQSPSTQLTQPSQLLTSHPADESSQASQFGLFTRSIGQSTEVSSSSQSSSLISSISSQASSQPSTLFAHSVTQSSQSSSQPTPPTPSNPSSSRSCS